MNANFFTYPGRIIFLLTLLFPFLTFSQWNWQNPLPQGNSLSSVFFTNSQTGYVVGSGGTIMKTINGGITWTISPLSLKTTFYSVFFTDANTGYIAGSDSNFHDLILKTTNAGVTWNTSYQGNSDESLVSIYFPTPNVGYAVGYWSGHLLKTTDGGANWTLLNYGYSSYFQSVYFTSPETGYIINAFGRLLKTTDGGITLDTLHTSPPWLSSIFFTDDTTGYLAGWGSLFKTTDAGLSWVMDTNGMNVPNHFFTFDFRSVFFTSSDTGYVCDADGNVFKTVNHGDTWSFEAPMQHEAGISAMFFADARTGFTIGGAEIQKTVNYGATWIPCTNGTYEGELYSLFFPDSLTGYVAGNRTPEGGFIMKTINGGENWSGPINLYNDVRSIYFTSKKEGFAVGLNYIGKTTDGGSTWIKQTNETNLFLNSVFFTNPNTGYIAAGDFGAGHGAIIKTIDAGSSWSPTLFNISLNSIYFPTPDIGYAVGLDAGGYYGSIIKTTDGGETWIDPIRIPAEQKSVFFINNDTGFVAGEYRIHKTIDGGATWTTVGPYCGTSYTSIFFSSPLKGYAVDDRGNIYKTMDGGSSWKSDSSLTANSLYSVFCTNNNTAYVAGSGVSILKSGIKPNGIEEKQGYRRRFSLNPNPATNKITISTNEIPEEEIHVTIYTLEGKKLVDKTSRFRNQTELDIGSLSVGLYLVKIKAGPLVEIDKLVKL
jgi:photosystem II stability/assembly factor-like uncharacterized protein